MGNTHSQSDKQIKQRLKVIGGISLILAGVAYYRWKEYQKLLESDLNDEQKDELKHILESWKKPDTLTNDKKETENQYKRKHISSHKGFQQTMQQKGGREAIQNYKLGDRRRKVILKKPFVDCIGMIIASNENDETDTCSTGTVFKTLRNEEGNAFFFVITCAHAILDADNNNNRFDVINFVRILPNGEEKEYELYRYEVYESKVNEIRDEDDQKYTYSAENDLAILVFEDLECHYDTIFRKQRIRKNGKVKEFISLLSADKLPPHVILTYSIYGFPIIRAENDPHYGKQYDKDGELWGMSSKSFIDSKEVGTDVNLYVHRKGPFFLYNAIDTEPGQSGSAIIVCFKDHTYAIVGVHIKGCNLWNRGIALTEKKIELMPKIIL